MYFIKQGLLGVHKLVEQLRKMALLGQITLASLATNAKGPSVPLRQLARINNHAAEVVAMASLSGLVFADTTAA